MKFSRILMLKGMRALAIGMLSVVCCAAEQQAARSHGAHSGDLVSALQFISITFHLPVIAELTQSYPTHVSVAAGQDTPNQILNALLPQLSGYTWVERDGVVLFFDDRLRNAPGNFFNQRIVHFAMPANAADLVLELNQRMGAEPGTARVMAGVPERALTAVRLHEGEIFTNVSGRDLLVQAAKESHNIFSVVLFPTPSPDTRKQTDEAHNNWYVRTVDELPQNPMHLRSIKPSTAGADKAFP